MRPLSILFIFLLLPAAEIWLMIEVGGVIGAGWTVLLLALTAVAGVALVRSQGLMALRRIQDMLGRGELPAREMLEGVCLLIAGALLLVPGFITDVLGVFLLVPMLRRGLVSGLLRRGVIHAAGSTSTPPPRKEKCPRVLEGESRRLDR